MFPDPGIMIKLQVTALSGVVRRAWGPTAFVLFSPAAGPMTVAGQPGARAVTGLVSPARPGLCPVSRRPARLPVGLGKPPCPSLPRRLGVKGRSAP